MIDIQKIKKQSGIIGSSDEIIQVLEMICQVAPVDISVLISGESGAGKEIVANLFLPIVHQIMDNSNYLLDEEVEDENTGRITHKCATVQ